MESFSIASLTIPIVWMDFLAAALSFEWYGRRLEVSYKNSQDRVF